MSQAASSAPHFPIGVAKRRFEKQQHSGLPLLFRSSALPGKQDKQANGRERFSQPSDRRLGPSGAGGT